MKTKQMLQGSECEYSMSLDEGQPNTSRRRSLTACHHRMLEAIRNRHDWLPDLNNPYGIYLDNGARYYLDCGHHNEYSSPEVSTPREIAACDRAAERVLIQARDDLRDDGWNICITKNNVNFIHPDEASWGQHEAYTCWIPLDRAAAQLIPHMASRCGYAGAGCLSADDAGSGYELSQRARHITCATGVETTHSRALFCTRAWKRSDVSDAGWIRTNLITKDSQRCSFGMYLTHGVTCLLFLIINRGYRIGANVQLVDPVDAMRTFSLDLWHQRRVRLANGKQASAIDIQREYLREARPHVESGDYPEWTCEVFTHWSQTLDTLEQQPLQLANRLDGYLKWSLFDHHLKRAGITWQELRIALQSILRLRRVAPPAVLAAAFNDSSAELDRTQTRMFRQLLSDRRARQIGWEKLRFAIRLQSLELRYHELGGLFDQLDAAGLIDSVVLDHSQVEHAMHHPPAGGRAAARSRLITQYQGQDWACDWEHAIGLNESLCVDMRDPFCGRYELKETPSKPSRRLPRRRRAEDVPF